MRNRRVTLRKINDDGGRGLSAKREQRRHVLKEWIPFPSVVCCSPSSFVVAHGADTRPRLVGRRDMLSVLENRRPAPRLPRRRRAVPRAAEAESREGEAAGGAQAEADEEAPAGRGRRDGRAFQLHVAVVDGEGGGLRRVPAPGHAPKTASVTMGLTEAAVEGQDELGLHPAQPRGRSRAGGSNLDGRRSVVPNSVTPRREAGSLTTSSTRS